MWKINYFRNDWTRTLTSEIKQDHIITIKYLSEDYDEYFAARKMYQGLKDLIKDNYPKYIVTLDEYAFGNYNGIKIIHLADFLLKDNY